jgi:hypothetical protein
MEAVSMKSRLETRDDGLYIVPPSGDGKKVIKGWESFNGCYWFATELVKEDYMDGFPLYYGYVQLLDEAWGDFWAGEFEPLIQSHKMWEINQIDLPISGRRS